MARVDVDRSPGTAARYGINGTPAVLLFKQGKAVGMISGGADKSEVVDMLESHM